MGLDIEVLPRLRRITQSAPSPFVSCLVISTDVRWREGIE